MSTTKLRINISLPATERNTLAKLAHRDRVPLATKAARLLELALELEEDQIWEEVASLRDVKKARYLSHDQAWK